MQNNKYTKIIELSMNEEIILYSLKTSENINIILQPNIKANFLLLLEPFKNFKLNININLNDNSELKFFMIMNNEKKYLKEVYINVDQKSKSTSLIKCFGIAKDDSTSFISLQNNSQKYSKDVSIFQDICIFLKGPNAKATALPILNIDNKNVKEAKHSCWIGNIINETLFYVTTHGISLDEAKKIILKSHMDNIISNFAQENINQINKVLDYNNI